MGLFLMMSGVAQADTSQVEAALREFAAKRSGTLAPLTVGENTDEDELLLIAKSAQGNVTVFYPSGFTAWDEASQHLSVALKTPVFSLHVHDSDLWMYSLFVNGQAVDRFNPVPGYWGEEEEPDSWFSETPPPGASDGGEEEEPEAWSGDATIVSQYWPNVSEAQIANYLVPWELDGDAGEGTKAYPEDKYGAGDDWQILDFMAKVGLEYPMDEQGNQHGAKFRLQVKA